MKKSLRTIEKQLVNIYIIALESFIPKEEFINLAIMDYLAIDMSNKYFNDISKEGKDEILNYFRDKYNVEVINASLNKLKEVGLTSSSGNDVDLIKNNKKGILLGITSWKYESKTKVLIEGYWFFTSVASAGIRTRIVFQNNEWILEKTDTIWIS